MQVFGTADGTVVVWDLSVVPDEKVSRLGATSISFDELDNVLLFVGVVPIPT